jgi:hypothetical protein
LLQNEFKFKIASYNKLWCKITTFNENTHDTLHIITQFINQLKMQISYFIFIKKNYCLVRFEPTTGSQQRPCCGREARRRGEGERERESATKRASISGDGGDPAAARAAAPQQ